LLAKFRKLTDAETKWDHPLIAVSFPVRSYDGSERQISARMVGKISVDEGLKQKLIDFSATRTHADRPDVVDQSTDPQMERNL
jgi:hypothetical protein